MIMTKETVMFMVHGGKLWFFQTIFPPYELAEEKVDGRKDVVNLVEISSQVRKVNQWTCLTIYSFL